MIRVTLKQMQDGLEAKQLQASAKLYAELYETKGINRSGIGRMA